MTPNILVAVTAYRGEVKVQCAMSLLKLQRQFHADGIQSEFRYADMTIIRKARNYFSTVAVQDNFTHLLFVDDDMDFEPRSVQKLIKADAAIAGCACVGRSLDVSNVVTLSKDYGLTLDQAISVASKFNVFMTEKRKKEPTLKVTNGDFLEVDGIGMGLTLIASSCLRQMIDGGHVEPDETTFRERPHGLTGPAYGFFSHFPSEAASDAEDYAFCQRWQQLCGGTILALVSDPIGHVGNTIYRAIYLERLKLGKR